VGRRDRKKAQHKSQYDEISNAASSAKNLHNRTLQPEILDTFPTPILMFTVLLLVNSRKLLIKKRLVVKKFS
jgi:hypothetical protein